MLISYLWNMGFFCFFFLLLSPKCVEYFISLGYGIMALQQGINYGLHKSVFSMTVINQHNGMHF